MKEITERVVALPLPTSSEDLYARLLNKRDADINDLLQTHFGRFFQDPIVFRLLAPIYNDESENGKVELDQFCAAKRIIELSGKDHFDIPQIAALKGAQAQRHLKVVLKRLQLMPWQRIEEAQRAVNAAAEAAADAAAAAYSGAKGEAGN